MDVEQIRANALARMDAKREQALKDWKCMECGEDLPEDNTVRHPQTGETKQSAMCPKCRKEIVDRFLNRRKDDGVQSNESG